MVEVNSVPVKKKKVCKRHKKNWRKYISTKDVDDFLDEKRLEERIGGPVKERKDKELFVIDTKTNKENDTAQIKTLSKKEKAKLPPTCFKLLQPLTAVPDPITKRNRVRTKIERMSSIRKYFKFYKRSQGFISKKELDAKKQRSLTLKKKKEQPTEHVFNKDIWTEKEENEVKNNEWFTEDTVRHTLTNTNALKVKVPKSLRTKKSVIPAIENPHPGISYNPSIKDHKDLLQIVIDKECDKLKEEAHIKRVTTDAFNKVSPQERDKMHLDELTEGLFKMETEVKEETEDEGENKETKPPVKPTKMKTRKQKRKQKEEKQAALMRKYAKVEKKKIADIHKLRFIKTDLEKAEEKSVKKQEKKKNRAIENVGKTKRLGAKLFEEPDLEFNRQTDLRGSLRLMKREGNLLLDRFYSLQKRNVLVPCTKQLPMKKSKVKKFVKASHKMDNIVNKKK
ncbi:ribosome biogenesis protein NOP53 [Cimex lectularius]|uniref:Ribosome biogenesis protein NOP53 n=1 Tax=Cimex lectularius TaxID=79782 RepID=A0A8I6S1N6_CIMLE|nr:ribosome biogenesis protein NOP53 [Cimex lectularius]